MTVTVEKLPDGPIIVVTFREPMDYHTEVGPAFHKIVEIRETITGFPKYYVIFDLAAIKPGFSDVVHSLSESRIASSQRRPDFPVNLHLVGHGRLLELVTEAMKQRQYGEYAFPLHLTLQEALDAIRDDMRAAKRAS